MSRAPTPGPCQERPSGHPNLRRSLHQIVDDLPDDDLTTARRVLQALRDSADPVFKAFANAPFDDEADEDDADGGLTEARRFPQKPCQIGRSSLEIVFRTLRIASFPKKSSSTAVRTP